MHWVLMLLRRFSPVCFINTVHALLQDDDKVSSALLNLIYEIEILAVFRGLAARYCCLNYGYEGQPILQSHRPESLAVLRAASHKYDPTGFSQTVVLGGFEVFKLG